MTIRIVFYLWLPHPDVFVKLVVRMRSGGAASRGVAQHLGASPQPHHSSQCLCGIRSCEGPSSTSLAAGCVEEIR